MLSTPKPARKLGCAGLGEPSRISRGPSTTPGGASAGDLEDASSCGRPIMGGGLTPRHSMSTRGNTAHRNSRDPRPVGDKAYQAQCAHTVVDFLAARGFGRSIVYEKFLREPIAKDFYEIFKFLISQLDPRLELEGTIEVEVPLMMKRLKYPVEVNKSKLQSITGPNTWPQLLAVLDWLITLIQVNDGLIEPVAECKLGLAGPDADCEEHHMMLGRLHDNYLEFLDMKDPEKLEAQLRQMYNDRADDVQGEIDQLQEQVTGMDTQLQDFRSEHERLGEIQAVPMQLEVEADRLRGIIQSQDAQAQRAEEEAALIDAEDVAVLAETEALEVKNKQLQEQVESQAYSKSDIERLKCERTHLRRMLEDLKSDAEKAEQVVSELGIEESRLEESTSRTVRFVNDAAETLEASMVAVGGPCAEELKVHVDLTEPTDALDVLDFSKMGTRVGKVVEAHEGTTRREEGCLHEVGEEQRIAQEQLSEKEREVRRLKLRLEQVSRMREEYRVWSDGHLDDARQTAEASEDNVRTAAISTAAPSVRDYAEADELRLCLTEVNTRHKADVAAMEDKLRREQEAFEGYQQKVGKEMQLALDSMNNLRDDVEKRVSDLAESDGTVVEARARVLGGS